MHLNKFGLLLLLLLIACQSKQPIQSEKDIYYTCSMHPQVVQHKRGNCPICGMQLVQMNKNKSAAADEIKLSSEQIKLGNITTDTIRMGSIGDKMVLTATLNFDQTNITSVSARTTGRIEKLFHKTPGDYVSAGSPIYDLYSEELNNAKQEYILALEKRKLFVDNKTVDFEQLIEAARNKLLLWGMNKAQITTLEESGKSSPITTFYSPAGGIISEASVLEGDYVMEGGVILKLANLSSLWAEAQVYTSQMAQIKPGSLVKVEFPDFASRQVKGKIEFVNPEIYPDTRINLIRVSIPNSGNQLKPGMPAYVVLESPKVESLALPIDAVIRDGKGATVWVQTAENTFASRMVETGLETGDRIEIRSGIEQGDIVVTTGAYLLQSEYIFKKGANPMAGHDMKNM